MSSTIPAVPRLAGVAPGYRGNTRAESYQNRPALLSQSGPQSTLQHAEEGIFVRRCRHHDLGGAGLAQDRGDIGGNAALQDGQRRDFDAGGARRLQKGARAARGIMQHRLDLRWPQRRRRSRAAARTARPSGRSSGSRRRNRARPVRRRDRATDRRRRDRAGALPVLSSAALRPWPADLASTRSRNRGIAVGRDHRGEAGRRAADAVCSPTANSGSSSRRRPASCGSTARNALAEVTMMAA